MSYEDERIVKMTFDNESFKKGVQDTIKALDNLDKKINSIDASTSYRTFDMLTKSVGSTEKAVNSFDESIQHVQASFSALQVVGITVLSELTRSAMQMGKQVWNNTLGQIKSGGVSRAMNIEAAKFQLEGLGVAWEDVSEQINYAVKGTAYGLDEAAKAAAQYSASFTDELINKYKELYSTTEKEADIMSDSLRAISGVAAMTNSSYSEIANIFTTVAGNGKVMTMQLRQLSYRGLNAAAKLAEAFNVTEDEIYDMVSKGKIGFAEFVHAMDQAFGEHAKKANDTFTGALSNMKAALSRIGEKFVTPWHEMKRQIYNAVTPLIDLIGEVVKVFQPTFTEITDSIAEWVKLLASNKDIARGLLNIAVGIYSWIYNIVKALREAGFALPKINDLAKSFEKFTRIFLLEGENAIKFREIVVKVATVLMGVVKVIGYILSAIKPLISMAIDFIDRVANNTDGIRDKLLGIAKQIAEIVYLVAKLIAMALPKILQGLITLAPKLIKVIKAIATVVIAIGTAIGWVIEKVIDFAHDFKEGARAIITNVGVIAEAFYKFYEYVKDTFKNIGEGITGFVGDLGDGAKSLIDKVKSLYSDKVITAKVKVVAEIPKIDTGSIIQNNASDSIKGASNAVSSYADSMKSAAKQSKSFGAIGSGGALKGAFGGSNIMGASAAVMQYAKAQEEASAITETTTSAMAKAVEAMNERIQDSTEETTEVVKEKSIFAKIKDLIPEDVQNFFQDVASKYILGHGIIMDLVSNFGKNFAATITNVSVVIAGSIISATAIVTASVVKAISALTANLRALPDLTGAVANAAKAMKYDAMADMLPELGKFLLAFGGLLLIIGVIAKFVDPTAFSTIIKYASLLMLAIAAITAAFGLLSIGGGLKMIGQGFNNLSKCLPNPKKVDTVKKRLEALGDMFAGLGALVLALTGSIMLITVYATKFGSFTDLAKSFLLVAGMLIMIATFTAIISKVIGEKSLITNCQTIDLATKSLKRESSNALGGVIAMMYSFVPLILSMTAAVAVLAQFNIKKTAAIFGLMMGMVATLMLTMIVMCSIVSRAVAKGKGIDAYTKAIGTAMSNIMKEMSKMMLSIVGFLLGFAAAAWILSKIDSGKLSKYIKIIAVAFGGIILVISGFIFWLSQMKRQTQGAKTLGSYSDFMNSNLQGIADIITALGTTMLAFAASLAILSIFDGKGYSDKMWKYAGIMSVMMLVTSVVVAVIAQSMSQFTKSFSRDHVWGKQENSVAISQMDSMGENIAQIIKALSGLAVSLSLAVAAMSVVPDDKMLIKAALIMAGLMMTIALIIPIISLSMRNLQTSTLGSTNVANNVSSTIGPNASSAIASMIQNMCLFVIAITGALAAVYLMASDPNRLWDAMSVLTQLVLTVAGGMIGLILAIRWLLTSTKGFDSKAVAKKLGSVASVMFVVTLAMTAVLGAVVGLASVFDKLNPDAVNKAIVTAGIVIAGITSIMALIAILGGKGGKKTNSKVKASSASIDAKTLFGIAAAMLALGSIFAIMAGVMKTLSTIDWSGLDEGKVYIGVFAVVALGLAAIFAALGKNVAAAVPGMLAFAAIIGMLGLLAISIGASTLMIAQAISDLKDVMISLQGVEIDGAIGFAKEFSKFISEIWVALLMGGFIAIPAMLFAIGINMLTSAIAKVKDVPVENLVYLVDMVKYVCESLAESVTVIMVATLAIILMSFIGPLITIAVASILVAIMMLPTIIEWIDKTLATLAAHSESMMTSIKKIAETFLTGFQEIMSIISTDELKSIVAWAAYFAAFGIILLIAGATLTIGALGLLAGSLILSFAMPVFKTAISETAQILGELGSTLGLAVAELLITGILIAVAGALLSLGSTGLAIGAGLLLVAAIALKEGFDQLRDAYYMIDFSEMFGLFAMLVAWAAMQTVAGLLLIVSGAIMLIGAALFAISAALLAVGILALSFALAQFEDQSKNVTTLSKLMDELYSAISIAWAIVIPSALFVVVSALFLAGTYILKSALDIIANLLPNIVKANTVMSTMKTMASNFLSAGLIFVAAAALFAVTSGIMLIGAVGFIASAVMIAGGFAILNEAYNQIGNIVEEFSNIGTDIINGLVHGIVSGWEAVKETFTNLGKMVIEAFRSSDVDSHSDSRGFIDIAKDIIGGLVHGTEDGEPTVMECFRELGDGVVDKFSGMGDKVESIAKQMGESAGLNLENGVLGGIGDTVKKGLPVMAGFFKSISGMGDAEINRQIKQYTAERDALGKKIASIYELSHGTISDPATKQKVEEMQAEVNSLNALIKDLEKSKSSTGDELDASGLADKLMKTLGLDNDNTSGGGSTPNIDTPDIQNPDTASDLGKLGKSAGSNAALASNVGGNVSNTITTNNNYNFIQNNYSPEPIDRTELYTQTENQHYTWYKWLRDNS